MKKLLACALAAALICPLAAFAPAGTAQEIVQRLNRELNAITRSPDVVDRLDKSGAEPAGGTPEQFAKVYRDEYDSWKAVIQRANIKPE